jgi:small subunit ribosomal protein S9
MVVKTALALTETLERFDVQCSVKGGGVSGQADAIRHGVARALLRFDPELRKKLRVDGLLTRDSRIKERKKYGQPGARKRFQFSKR